jgi:ribonuclease BN (tRNA processing enzyme)
VQKIEHFASNKMAGGGSAMFELSERNRLNSAMPVGGWRESAHVFVMVLLPVPLASILFAVGIFAMVGWYWLYNQPFQISAKASMTTQGANMVQRNLRTDASHGDDQCSKLPSGLEKIIDHRCIFYSFLAAIGFVGVLTGQALSEPTIPSLELVVLGSGGPGAVGRAASCHLVLVDGTPRIMVDAGPGCFARLGETGLTLSAVGIQLLTHLHADHAGDLPGLFKARAVATRDSIRFEIFGPDGHGRRGELAYFPATSQFVNLLFGEKGAFAYLPDFAARMTFDVKDLPAALRPGQEPTIIYSRDGLVIRAIAGHHSDAPSIIYRIDHSGKSITFSGDIDPSGLDNLRKIANDTSLLVVNSAVLDPPKAPPILYTLHSPPMALGRVAKESKAHSLVLAHLSPATDQNRDEVEESIRAYYGGPVTFAEDKLHLLP